MEKIDGKKIAQKIISELRVIIIHESLKPKLFVIVVGNDYATKSYVSLKQRAAEDIGIKVEVEHFDESTNTETLIRTIKEAENSFDGIIVQLPLPTHINKEEVLNSIPTRLDIDFLSEKSNEDFKKYTELGPTKFLPPVVAAISEILDDKNFDVKDKKAVVVGRGALVGKPVAVWLEIKKANVTVLDKSSKNFSDELQKADIIVTGAGVPNLITPDMIKDNVVLLDAATSESGGGLVGDTDPRCDSKALFYSPVPGGIGPITVATLLQNLVTRALG